MNIKQAKAIPIPLIMEKLGIKPVKQAPSAVWYLSPFREERTASFKVNTGLNTRYDFGGALGGDGIKLIQDLKNTNVRGALDILDSGGFASLPAKEHQSEIHIPRETNNPLVLLGTQAIRYFPLKAYLKDRGISPEISEQYLVQVHYSSGAGKRFIALGFQNDVGGYEVRNKYFKGLVGAKKSITSIGLSDFDTVFVFEGFFDFLAFASRNQKQAPVSAYLILNGISCVGDAIETLNRHTFKKVSLMMDNDTAGQKATQTFMENLKANTVTDESVQYTGFADYAEMRESKN